MSGYEGHVFDGSGNYLGEWGDVDAPINLPSIPAYGDHGAGYIGEWPSKPIGHAAGGVVSSIGVIAVILTLIFIVAYAIAISLCILVLVTLTVRGLKAIRHKEWRSAFLYLIAPASVIALGLTSIFSTVIRSAEYQSQQAAHEKEALEALEQLKQGPQSLVVIRDVKRVRQVDISGTDYQYYGAPDWSIFVAFTLENRWGGDVWIDEATEGMRCYLFPDILVPYQTRKFACMDFTVEFDPHYARGFKLRDDAKEPLAEVCLDFRFDLPDDSPIRNLSGVDIPTLKLCETVPQEYVPDSLDKGV